MGKAYTIAQLVALKAEYLATLSDDDPCDWYCTSRRSADSELQAFLKWLNIKENTP
jgi:hypothetical protein